MWHSIGFYRRRGLLGPLILRLLGQGPLSGMEIMDLIEKRTRRHHWRPSPGSIYPRLRNLTEEGLIRKREDGRYELTARALSVRSGEGSPPARTASEALSEMEGLTEYLEDLQRSDPDSFRLDPSLIDRLTDRVAKLKPTPPRQRVQ